MIFDNDGDAEFEASHASEVSDVIAQVLAELPAEGDEPEYETVEAAAPSEGEPVVDVETAPDDPESAETPPETPKEDDAAARGMLRLQEKEAELRVKQEAFEAEKKALDSKLADYERRLTEATSAPKGLDAKALKDGLTKPLDFLKAQGVDPLQVARIIVAQHMVASGAQVPRELQDEIYKAQQASELADVRAEIEKDRKALAVERARMGTRDYVRGEGISKYPALAQMTKVDPEMVGEEVVALTDSGLSKEEACAKLNAKWEKFQKAFGTPSNAPDSKNAAVSAESATKGTVQKTVKKAPPRQTPYWEVDDRAGEVAAAIAEATAIAKGRAPIR